jgi:ubiquinone/menaquinone biosynthesis C-methylase UbiE
MSTDPIREHLPLGNEPPKTAGYLEKAYWDQRFEKEEQYEWFKGFSVFRHLLLPHLRPSDRILVLGCGNSAMTMDLWREGFKNICSIDLSEVVIEKMRRQAEDAGMGSLRWEVADMLSLPFTDTSFDVVLEKGSMDVLFVDNDSPWNPRPEVVTRVHTMLAEAHRVLAPGGKLISITFAQPHFRRPFFLAPQYTWSMSHKSFGETFHYFVYNLQKGCRREADTLETQTVAPEGCSEPMTHSHMDEESYLMAMDL